MKCIIVIYYCCCTSNLVLISTFRELLLGISWWTIWLNIECRWKQCMQFVKDRRSRIRRVLASGVTSWEINRWNEALMGSLFTMIEVNTLGRSNNVDDVMLSSIGWQNDALTVRFSSTKSDQAGVRISEQKRMCANPFRPDVCVVLSLAVYLWCVYRDEGSDR